MSKIFALTFLAVVAISGAACKKPASAAAGGSTATPSASSPTNPAAQAVPPPPAPPAVPVPQTLPDVLARVNNEDVKKTDFEMLLRNVEANNGPIPANRRDEILRRVLDELVNYTLLKQEARARNVTATDAEVEEQIQAMRKSAPSEEAFQKALKDQKMSLERLRADAKAQIAIGKMMDAEVATAQAATDAEAKEFYDKNPERFKQPELVRASHILIRVEPSADEATKKQARAKIEGVLTRAKAGEDFATLAQQNSQDGSAAQGGDLDFFPKEKMVPPFGEVAFGLKTGQISDVVTTQFGYHIIKTTDRKAASTLPLAEVNDKLKQGLSQQKKQQHAQGFISQLRQKSKVEVLI